MKQDFYRGPLDKMVSLSEFSGKKIAEEMGITYNRMVALRRAKKIHERDLELCGNAIQSLENPPPEPHPEPEPSLEEKLTSLSKDVDIIRTHLQEMLDELRLATY